MQSYFSSTMLLRLTAVRTSHIVCWSYFLLVLFLDELFLFLSCKPSPRLCVCLCAYVCARACVYMCVCVSWSGLCCLDCFLFLIPLEWPSLFSWDTFSVFDWIWWVLDWFSNLENNSAKFLTLSLRLGPTLLNGLNTGSSAPGPVLRVQCSGSVSDSGLRINLMFPNQNVSLL